MPAKAGRRAGKERLSRVYLDDYPVTLMGDEAQPPLSRIVRAGGKDPDRVDVVYLTSPSDRKGRVVDSAEIVDRTAEPTRPIYLRSVPKPDVKPVTTALPGRVRDDAGIASRSGSSVPGADPTIAQLGREPARREHEPWVFRSPSQSPPPKKAEPRDVKGAQERASGTGDEPGERERRPE